RTLAHELKTPLALVDAYRIGIEEGLDDGTFVTEIGSATTRMQQIVARFLEATRLDAHLFQTEQGDVSALLIQSIAAWETLYRRRGVELVMDYNSDVPFVTTYDRSLVQILVSNVLDNALKHTSGQMVKVELSDRNGELIWCIKNATTLNLEQVSHLFRPYVQYSNSPMSSGLGLSIIHEICTRLKWTVTLDVAKGEFMISIQIPKAG
ncbi:MAG: sensor histidine kinase, partial [Bacilli bacterium]